MKNEQERPFIIIANIACSAAAGGFFWWQGLGVVGSLVSASLIASLIHWKFLGGEHGQADVVSRGVSFVMRALSKVGEATVGGPPPRGIFIAPPIVTSEGTRIVWAQDMPKSLNGRRLMIWTLALIGIYGLLSGSNAGTGWGVFRTLVGLIIAGALSKTLNLFAWYKEWSEKPITKKIHAFAFISGPTQQPRVFEWGFRAPRGEEHSGKIPLDTVGNFEVGTYQQWFSPLHEDDKRRRYFVIVVRTPSRGPQCVAAHAGSRAEIGELHDVLTEALSASRAPALQRADVSGKAAPPGLSQTDDLPRSL
jgi:hypothetical protein